MQVAQSASSLGFFSQLQGSFVLFGHIWTMCDLYTVDLDTVSRYTKHLQGFAGHLAQAPAGWTPPASKNCALWTFYFRVQVMQNVVQQNVKGTLQVFRSTSYCLGILPPLETKQLYMVRALSNHHDTPCHWTI